MTPPRHVLMLLANGFRPDPRVHREARALVRHGYEVTILCLDRDCDLPSEETVDGIRVERVRAGHVRPGQAASVGPALARFYALVLIAAHRIAAARPIALVHAHDFDTMAPALALGARFRVPVVYDMHDLYSSFFHDARLEAAAQAIDRLYYRGASAQVVVNEGFFDIAGIERDKATVVMNVPDLAGAGPCPDTDAGLFYAGNLEARRDMRYAFPAIAAAGMHAEFAGDGPLLEAHRQAASEGMRFLGRVPPAEVVERTRRCLAVLSLYDTTFKNNRLSTPNKLFDAMKFGKPTIVCADTVAANIVRARDAGLVVPYGDASAFARALEELRDPGRYATMCRNAYAAFVAEYHWERMEERLFALYERLLASR